MNVPELPLEPPEDKIIAYCSRCLGEIYAGDWYYVVTSAIMNGKHNVCKDCMRECAYADRNYMKNITEIETREDER